MFYPAGGAGNALSDAVMASYGIRYGNNDNTAGVQACRPLYGGMINPYKLWSYTADGKTFAQIRTAVDHAIKYGGYLGLLWHDGDETDEAAFTASMDYLFPLKEANVIDLVSYETFFSRFINPRKAR
jgi:hypothetical protein